MDEVIKTAAKHLLDIADQLDKEAAEHTIFACKSCEHSASLKTINETIKSASISLGKKIASVDVNDEISCIRCSSTMSYSPTEKSAAYYEEAGEKDSAMFKQSPPEPVDEVGEVELEESKTASKIASDAGIDMNKLSEYLSYR